MHRLVACALVVAGVSAQSQRAIPRDQAPVSSISSTGPTISIWYRGSPAGTPRLQDLEAIRAHGFRSVTWLSRNTAGAPELYRLAATLNLQVTLRIDSVPLTSASAKLPGDTVDIQVETTPPESFSALVWRALAHGARTVSFDAGAKAGPGLDAGGRPLPWVTAAQALAVELSTQAQLIENWEPGGHVSIVRPAPAALDLALLADDRSWVLVATNTSRARVRAVAQLPAGVPSALWANLRDGSMLSMINQPSGPRWSLDLDGGAARVYVVNK